MKMKTHFDGWDGGGRRRLPTGYKATQLTGIGLPSTDPNSISSSSSNLLSNAPGMAPLDSNLEIKKRSFLEERSDGPILAASRASRASPPGQVGVSPAFPDKSLVSRPTSTYVNPQSANTSQTFDPDPCSSSAAGDYPTQVRVPPTTQQEFPGFAGEVFSHSH